MFLTLPKKSPAFEAYFVALRSDVGVNLAPFAPSPHFSQGGSACGGNLMSSKYFKVDALDTGAMHADPIAALDALKLASLVLQSTHSPRYGQGQLKRASRTARGGLDSAHRSRSL